MKRAFMITMAFIFILFSLNSFCLAEEAEKKPQEEANVEYKAEAREAFKEPVREFERERDEGRIFRELFDMIRQQNEEIRQLREEIFRLRKLIEERMPVPQPLIRRGEGNPPRRLDEGQPREEYQRFDEQRLDRPREFERPMEIDSEIRNLEDKVRRDPNNIDARMRLARLYEDRGKIESAIEQYKIITKIKPDFNPPYTAIKRLEARQRESRPEEEFNIGEVISSSIEEVTIKTLEGETVTFKVPKVRKDDGTWAPNKEIGDRANALKKGEKVKIFWNRVEGEKIIRRIE
ncbi:MAG: tetratricopeptide repeat protein [Candidatus Poribacteria bacterium]